MDPDVRIYLLVLFYGIWSVLLCSLLWLLLFLALPYLNMIDDIVINGTKLLRKGIDRLLGIQRPPRQIPPQFQPVWHSSTTSFDDNLSSVDEDSSISSLEEITDWGDWLLKWRIR